MSLDTLESPRGQMVELDLVNKLGVERVLMQICINESLCKSERDWVNKYAEKVSDILADPNYEDIHSAAENEQYEKAARLILNILKSTD